MFHRYESALQQLTSKAQYRHVKEYIPLSSTHVLYKDKPHLMMASNNYLGLSFHPQVIHAAQEALQTYGTGATGARLTSGTHPLFQTFESRLANFKETESALVFTTGYMANVGTITGLACKGDIIFSDSLNHASLIDGCRLSGATIQVYPHGNLSALEEQLRQSSSAPLRLIVTDGVFSMDGDIAPLDKLLWLAEKYDAFLLVDDAHATGVIGDGRGTAHHFHLHSPRIITTGTMSKALGSVGGYVCTPQIITDYLINHSRPFIFATSLSPADMAASLTALELTEKEPNLLHQLHYNMEYMHKNLTALGISSTSDTPIFPIILGSNERTNEAAQLFEENHIILGAIRPPTVPIGTSRLRLTVTAAHKEEDLRKVLSLLEQILQKDKK